jgi:hypothetical protein
VELSQGAGCLAVLLLLLTLSGRGLDGSRPLLSRPDDGMKQEAVTDPVSSTVCCTARGQACTICSLTVKGDLIVKGTTVVLDIASFCTRATLPCWLSKLCRLCYNWKCSCAETGTWHV